MNEFFKFKRPRLDGRILSVSAAALTVGLLQLPAHMPLAKEELSEGMMQGEAWISSEVGLTAFAIEHRVTLPVAASELWALVGEFDGLHNWHPAIAATKISEGGRIRTVYLAGGGSIVESLEETGESLSYAYRILEGPLPVSNYYGVLRVTAKGAGKAELTWSSHFSATDSRAVDVIGGIYQQGFNALSERFGGR